MNGARVLVVVPGFGMPHRDKKVEILKQNMAALKSLNPEYTIFAYDAHAPLCDGATWIFERGIIGHFIKKHITPEFIKAGAYDYVILLLDDVELDPAVNYPKILEFMNSAGLDMVSPCLATRDSSFWGDIMVPRGTPDLVARVMPFIEFFCYIFRADAFCEKYWPYVDAENPWMWGLDFILASHMKLRAGLLDKVTMKHHYANSAYSKELNDPRRDSERYLERHGTSWATIHANPKNKESIALVLAHDSLVRRNAEIL